MRYQFVIFNSKSERNSSYCKKFILAELKGTLTRDYEEEIEDNELAYNFDYIEYDDIKNIQGP